MCINTLYKYILYRYILKPYNFRNEAVSNGFKYEDILGLKTIKNKSRIDNI